MLGYDYPDSPVVVPDAQERRRSDPGQPVTAYEPSAHPGARLPHAWLPDGRSLYDLLGDGFTVLRLSAAGDVAPLVQAASDLGVPLRVLDLPHLPRLRDVCDADLVLVRPDQHVAWRGTRPDDADALLRHVVGTPSAVPSPLEELSR